jgi:hypothetical protein
MRFRNICATMCNTVYEVVQVRVYYTVVVLRTDNPFSVVSWSRGTALNLHRDQLFTREKNAINLKHYAPCTHPRPVRAFNLILPGDIRVHRLYFDLFTLNVCFPPDGVTAPPRKTPTRATSQIGKYTYLIFLVRSCHNNLIADNAIYYRYYCYYYYHYRVEHN